MVNGSIKSRISLTFFRLPFDQTATKESPITRIFGGKLRSVLRCPGQKDSVTIEPFQRLQLDIQVRGSRADHLPAFLPY